MAKNTGIRLSTKLTLVTAALIILTVLISVFVTLYFGNQIAEDSIDKKLNNSQQIQQEFNQQKLRQLELVSLVVASDPAFVAYVAQTIFDLENGADVDVASIADLLLERKQQYGFDVAIIASVDGQQLARSDQAMSPARDLSKVELMQRGMDELIPISGYWSDQDQIYQAAVVPLARGRTLIGFLITGIGVNDSLGADIARLTGTEVVILSKENNQISSIASTLDLDLNANLIGQLNNPAKQFELSDQGQFNLSLDDLNLAVQTNQMAQLQQQSFYILNGVSLDLALAPFSKTRNILLAVGLAMILLAFLVASLLVNRSLAPLSRMSAATRQVSFGNYAANFPTRVGRDLGDLSESINQLVQKIRGREALASHMIELSKKSHHAIDQLHNPPKSIIEPGKVLNNRYEVIENIGVGGMGAVFKAFDKDLDEVVALKVMKANHIEDDDINQFVDRWIFYPHIIS